MCDNSQHHCFRFSIFLPVEIYRRYMFGPKMVEIWGFLPLIYFRGHFKSPIAVLLLPTQPRHVVKFRKCRLNDVEKSASGKMFKNIREIYWSSLSLTL